jgi:hypothetical protein
MFETKKTALQTFSKKVKAASTTAPKTNNAFLKASLKQSASTTSLGNGALKVTTTGNDFVDQFGKCTIYKAPRTFADVSKDMSLLYSQDALKAVQFAAYLRLITRQVQFAHDGSKTEHTQRGQGLRHEGIFRMIWLAINKPDAFWRNVSIFIAVGSWKDIITMLQYDLVYNGWEGRKLDWDNFGQLILAGLENPRSSELLKKYLPQIKANSNCTTVEAQADNMIAKWICSLIFGTKGGANDSSKYKSYRKLKSGGTAHQWQQLISQKKMLSIDFDSIHGRALSLLVSGKFLKNSGLETKYTKWIESKPVAKYTGYVYELLSAIKTSHRPAASLTRYQEETINKQFLGLVEVGKNGLKEGDNGLLVIVDSSGSMTSAVQGTKVSAYSVALSMALYFSYLLKGQFEGHFAEFSDTCIMKTWKGGTPVEKFKNETSAIVAGTNFQAIGTLFVQMLKKGVPESDFPSGILCVSDGCFNSAGSNKSNHQRLLQTLRSGGFSEDYVKNFKTILWDVPNGYYSPKGNQAFEDFADCPNLYHIGGLDPAAVAFVTGVEGRDKPAPKNSEELFEAAMEQEVLEMIQV